MFDGFNFCKTLNEKSSPIDLPLLYSEVCTNATMVLMAETHAKCWCTVEPEHQQAGALLSTPLLTVTTRPVLRFTPLAIN